MTNTSKPGVKALLEALAKIGTVTLNDDNETIGVDKPMPCGTVMSLTVKPHPRLKNGSMEDLLIIPEIEWVTRRIDHALIFHITHCEECHKYLPPSIIKWLEKEKEVI